jgi:hypothetical protein
MNANRHDPARELLDAPENLERAVERAAEAMWDMEGGDHIPWERLSAPAKAMWRRRANAALQSQREEDVTASATTAVAEIGFRTSWGIRK